MDCHGFMLFQVSRAKLFVDQINEQIEACIRKTGEIESKVIDIFDKEKEILKEEEDWKMQFILKGNQLEDLSAVSESLNHSVAMASNDLHLIEEKREALLIQICNERETFIACCKTFQQNLDSSGSLSEMEKLLSTKEELQNNINSLKWSIQVASEPSRMTKNRDAYIQDLLHEIQGFQSLIQLKDIENETTLKDIGHLMTSLQYVKEFEEPSWELQSENEDKRQFQDCLIGLQLQLPQLSDEERRLHETCIERQKVLHKIEEEIQGQIHSADSKFQLH